MTVFQGIGAAELVARMEARARKTENFIVVLLLDTVAVV